MGWPPGRIKVWIDIDGGEQDDLQQMSLIDLQWDLMLQQSTSQHVTADRLLKHRLNTCNTRYK